MEAALAFQSKTEGFGLPAARNILNRLLLPEPSFSLHNIHSPQRIELEAYIAGQFERTYGATVTQYLPELFSMQCQGRLSAVAGIRSAIDGDLFVEQYLDEPVEQTLSRLSPTCVRRSDVIEIGNLAGTHRGACLLFFILHATIMHRAGFKWAVFAATDQVDKIIRKLNFVTIDLGAADPVNLGEDAARWGSYYDTNPTVRAVDIAATVARFHRSTLPAAVIRFFSDTIDEIARSIRTRTFQ